ncbi:MULTISPECIES: hypothetical protein [Achromobacter]|uniref:Protein L n=1 Tax=Alcaligenes xylosoxydans xylosoxydans TaxID=85698 RepID=A0A0X8NXT2_ALCXX|nr:MULTISPECIES: hypothetical protein [Achromobacter]AMG36259.1 protein L [Achromobacter xylosoxidans]MBD9476486.1 protein L [Achromobacter sp. ACM01]
MAYYQNANELTAITHAAFGQTFGPANPVPHSGIYKCRGCHAEIAANQGDPLPPQNRHQHTAAQGQIRWQLIVATQ